MLFLPVWDTIIDSEAKRTGSFAAKFKKRPSFSG